jgi:hypothetical protein
VNQLIQLWSITSTTTAHIAVIHLKARLFSNSFKGADYETTDTVGHLGRLHLWRVIGRRVNLDFYFTDRMVLT